jgi:DNA-binding XRE family transcriptional regulator
MLRQALWGVTTILSLRACAGSSRGPSIVPMSRAYRPPESLRLDFRPMRAVRQRLDVTQAELAHACKVYAKAPVYWERNERPPTFEAVIRAARFLGTPWWQLVEITEDKAPASDAP